MHKQIAINDTMPQRVAIADLEVEFTKPGDYITYDITVENKGTIDSTINLSSNTDVFLSQLSFVESTAKLTETNYFSFLDSRRNNIANRFINSLYK